MPSTAAQMKRYRERRRRKNLCPYCPNRILKTQHCCDPCKIKHAAKVKAWRASVKRNVSITLKEDE